MSSINQRVLILLTISLVALPDSTGQSQPPALNVASYSGNPDQRGGGYGLQSIWVYPLSGGAQMLRLPFAIGQLIHSFDGKALFATAFYTSVARGTPGAPDRPGLYRFDLPSMHMTEVSISPDLGIHSLVVSKDQDKLIVSAQRPKEGRLECGFYEVHLPGGETRLLFETNECGPIGHWDIWSISTDGERILAARKDMQAVIDMRRKTIQPLGKSYGRMWWSPDGKWIARSGGKGADILDAQALKTVKSVSEHVVGGWSPDSRYLIGAESTGCIGDLSTLLAIDVFTGEKHVVENSHCKPLRAVGWMTDGVLPISK